MKRAQKAGTLYKFVVPIKEQQDYHSSAKLPEIGETQTEKRDEQNTENHTETESLAQPRGEIRVEKQEIEA